MCTKIWMWMLLLEVPKTLKIRWGKAWHLCNYQICFVLLLILHKGSSRRHMGNSHDKMRRYKTINQWKWWQELLGELWLMNTSRGSIIQVESNTSSHENGWLKVKKGCIIWYYINHKISSECCGTYSRRVLSDAFMGCMFARNVGILQFWVTTLPNIDGFCFNMGHFKALRKRSNIRTIRTCYPRIVRCTDVSKMALHDIL